MRTAFHQRLTVEVVRGRLELIDEQLLHVFKPQEIERLFAQRVWWQRQLPDALRREGYPEPGLAPRLNDALGEGTVI